MRTIELKLFKFSELSEEAQGKALLELNDINVDFNWWECTYEDAKTIGVNISGFDLDRNKHCTGDLQHSLNESTDSILEHHGEDCKTVAIAKRYIAEWADLVEKFSDGISKDKVIESNEYDFDLAANELESEFLKDILSEYANMLQNESEHLMTDEAIKKTIEANEYEFTEDGKQY
jgi:hypothetical protein